MLLIRILPILLIALYAVPSQAEIKPSKYPKVYKGEEGLKVTFIDLSPKSMKQALIQISGIDTEIDGKVFLYKMAKQGRDKNAFQMQYNGSTVTRLVTQDGYWNKSTTIYLPDSRKGKTVRYAEKESKEVDIEAIMALYKRDKELQKELAKYNRKNDEIYNNEKIQELIEATEQDCGHKVAVTSNIEKASDDMLKEYSFYSYCGRPLTELARYCRKSPENKKTVAAKVSKVICNEGDKLKARLKGKTIHWDWEVKTGNQDDFVFSFLNNNL
jgi:hypothetical protein